MKRALLIAGGTLGGLGAVMAITPPQLSATNSLGMAGAGAIGATTSTPAATASSTPAAATTQAASPSATTTSKAVVTKKKKTTASKSATASASASATPTQSATASATPTPTKTTAAPVVTKAAASSASGTFVGPSVFVNYGNVQVEITVSNGKITDAKALQSPNGRSQRWSDMALPQLRQQTLSANGDQIQGASGASYTSYGWYKSLQGAMAKAGLPTH
jgi:uncharacterized protein with FMN-binding domain